MATPTLAEITAEWLKAHGYGGLCSPHDECGCGTDDLMPCDQPSTACAAAWLCGGALGCDGCDRDADAETWYCTNPKAKEQDDE